jgi:two-component system chemotaxis response regulator CheB
MGPARERQLDIVAIGASAGGVEAISNLLHALPRMLPAAILIALHRSPYKISKLQHILSSGTTLPVVVPHGGEQLQRGFCFLGHPDRHLTLGPDLRVHLLPNSFYRAHNIDALFCSLARHAGSRTIGVVLSGVLKDGTLGLKAIKEAGGVALVQSPEEAVYPDMPRSAIEHDGDIDLVGPVGVLAAEICRLVGQGPAAKAAASENAFP